MAQLFFCPQSILFFGYQSSPFCPPHSYVVRHKKMRGLNPFIPPLSLPGVAIPANKRPRPATGVGCTCSLSAHGRTKRGGGGSLIYVGCPLSSSSSFLLPRNNSRSPFLERGRDQFSFFSLITSPEIILSPCPALSGGPLPIQAKEPSLFLWKRSQLGEWRRGGDFSFIHSILGRLKRCRYA